MSSCYYIANKMGELRIMFYNIYGYKWYPDKQNQPHLSSGPIPLRQQMELTIIKNYVPDVLGMQEYCTAFNNGMTPLLEGEGYTRVDVWHTEQDKYGNKLNFTPLFYRADKMVLIDRGFFLYDGPNDVNSKSLTWAVFEELKHHKRFVAIATHFMYNDPTLAEGVANSTRVENAKQLLEQIDKIYEKDGGVFDGLPIIIGGDLNCVFGSDPFVTLKNGGLQWLYDIAENKNESAGIKKYATYDDNIGDYITCPTAVTDPKRAIDYMWLKQGKHTRVSVATYITVTDREASLASDHCPRFADLNLE